MNAPVDAIKKGRKYEQVLRGAREVFLRDGFEGASVDEIARAARVSKATLYSYFPDKRLLFTEVVTCECGRQAERAIERIDMTAPVERVLEMAARHMLAFLTSEFGQRVFRVCVAECDRFPELGQIFYDSGPAKVRRELAAYFRSATAAGALRIEDFDLAADQFAELCKAHVFARMVFGIQRRFAPEELDRVISGAVATFTARYGVDDPAR